MSRKLLRTGLAACVLAGLVAVPAQAADFGSRSVTEGFWRWLTEVMQAVQMTHLTIDPNGSNGTTDISLGTEPNGDGLTSSGDGTDIHMTIDPNG